MGGQGISCTVCGKRVRITVHPSGGFQYRCSLNHWRRVTSKEHARILDARYRGVRYLNMEIPGE